MTRACLRHVDATQSYQDRIMSLSHSDYTRRGFLRTVASSALIAGTFNFRELISLRAEDLRQGGMSMILLYMQGGPSQFETFDPKPGMDTGGPTKAISTASSGIEIAEPWANVAKQMNDIALIR